LSRLPEPIGDDVRRELGRFGPESALGDVVAAWPAAVGPAIAANAWPARISRDGTLHVATSSSAWAFELTQLGDSVLARLQEHVPSGCPASLRFAVGPLPEAGADPEPSSSRTVPTPDPAVRAEAERIADSIEDEELRRSVARAAAASLNARKASGDDRPVW
jgi:hypothetical protein